MPSHALDFRSAAGLMALQTFPRVGAATALRTALEAQLRASVADRLDVPKLEAAFEDAQERLSDYQRAGVEVLSFFDQRYPDRLRELSDPPTMLFVRGNVELLRSRDLVAVVGTREPTLFGESAARFVTEELAAGGYGIVSGLAKGIDTIAHETALAAGAPTIAVLGGGLEKVYPAENKKLAARIVAQNGTLVSEQPFGVPPRPSHLIARDRLQSGLSLAVVVTQCGLRSGTMHTARYAAAQGRPIFCPVPQSDNGASEGLRALLQRPARELSSLLPAWKGAEQLCARLGERRLGHPITRERGRDFLDAMRRLQSWSESENDTATLVVPPADH
jgi:DNA processing protein